MYQITITYAHQCLTDAFATQLEEQFAAQDEVEILSKGVSNIRREGMITLQWDGHVDITFLHQLNSDPLVFDYCLSTLLERPDDEEIEETINQLYGPSIRPLRGDL